MRIKILFSEIRDVVTDVSWLSIDERARLDKATDERARAVRFASFSFARHALAGHLKVPPSELQIERSTEGKPYLIGRAAAYSVSHSGDWIAIAISCGGPVGLDIQKGGSFSPKLVDRILTPLEKNQTGQVSRDFLYRMWTLKEAVLKCIGSGFMIPMKALETYDHGVGEENCGAGGLSRAIRLLMDKVPADLSAPLKGFTDCDYLAREIAFRDGYFASVAWPMSKSSSKSKPSEPVEILIE